MAHDSDVVSISESVSAPVLHIQLLGKFRLVYGNETVTSIEAPRLQALLAYLVLHRDAPQSRQHIAFLLFPDSSEAQARTNLRKLVHLLRKALPAADRFLITDAQTLQWNSDAPFTLDVDDFENTVAHASSSATLREAVNLYRGELLPGCYDDWILPEREQLRQKFVETLERLILLLENQRDYRAAISFTESLLRQDPLREETYRRLMRLHVLSGDNAGARRAYQTCVAVLKRELDTEPSQETRAEFERLFNQAAAAEKSASARNVRGDVSPPKTIHTSPNNLPVQLTSFIGREQQIADLKRLLSLQNASSSRTRLLTFTGAGGSGKTRLATQVANELLPSFQDGAWFVDLAPLVDPALIPQAIASALSVHEQPGRALLDTLLDYLRDKELLLIFDNCEQFVAACAELVRTLLEKCPRVQIIATSRERLNLAGETVWLVPTLSLPDEGDGEWIDAAHSESVHLFVERAVSALSTFALTRQNAPAVAQICRRLDGIPLAIELAAARIKVLTPVQIAARLDDTFRLLTRGSHAAPPRQQTLRAAMDWSYALLSAPEQMLFRRLSVFAGGFTLESAEEVCGDNGRRTTDDGTESSFILHPDEILDLLSDLVDKSLVVVAEWKEGEHVRYRMLETIREYAHEKLEQKGETKQIGSQYATYFLELAESGDLLLRGYEQLTWFRRFETEHDNMRGALRFLWLNRRFTEYLTLASSLAWFWERYGYLKEGSENLNRGLNAAQSHSVPEQLLAKALCGSGALALRQNDSAFARVRFKQSLTLWQQLDDVSNVGLAQIYLGSIDLLAGNLEGAAGHYEAALDLLRQAGDKWEIGSALGNLGFASLFRGDLPRAQVQLHDGFTLLQQVGEQVFSGVILFGIAYIQFLQGEGGRARIDMQEGLRLVNEMGEKPFFVYGMIMLANILAVQEPTRAVRLFGAAMKLSELFGAPLPPLAQTMVDQIVGTASAQIDSATFSASREEGLAMTLEQAIALALEVK